MSSKLLSTTFIAPFLTSVLAASTAAAAGPQTTVCYPVGSTAAASSTASAGMPQFFVTVKWGPFQNPEGPFKQGQQAAYVDIQGNNLHQSGPVVFQQQSITTRCENGLTKFAKLGSFDVLQFTQILYKGNCGGHKDGVTLTVKPGTPQQVIYTLKCNP